MLEPSIGYRKGDQVMKNVILSFLLSLSTTSVFAFCDGPNASFEGVVTYFTKERSGYYTDGYAYVDTGFTCRVKFKFSSYIPGRRDPLPEGANMIQDESCSLKIGDEISAELCWEGNSIKVNDGW